MAARLGLGALIAVALVGALALLELRNNATFRINADAIVLFSTLWLLAATVFASVAALFDALRTRRMAWSSLSTLASFTLLIGLVAVWLTIVIDQMPCFMGVPNCD